MANRARGEVSVEIGGKAYAIAWTLGAQAEVEDAFGVEFAEDAFPIIFKRTGEGDAAIVRVSARAGRTFLEAVLRGCGHDLRDVNVGAIAPADFADALSRLFTAAGFVAKPAAEVAEARPIAAAGSGGINDSGSASDTSH